LADLVGSSPPPAPHATLAREPRRRALSLKELEVWLASDQVSAKSGWNVSAVDGFLAGIVAGSEPIEPKEWARLIFGPWPLGKDGNAALQAVLDRHIAVAKILAEAPAPMRRRPLLVGRVRELSRRLWLSTVSMKMF
jgi:hypothetical protein